jgi:phosphatidylglycerophosphate synthase
VSALCDAVDGFVARESATESEAGEIFDAVVDRYNEFFFLSGLALLFHASPGVLSLILATIHGSFMVSYASAKGEALHLTPPRGWMRRPERATYLTAGAALSPIAGALSERLGVSAAVAAAAPIVGSLLLVGIGANVSAVRRLLGIARMSVERAEHAGSYPSRAAAEKPKLHPVPRWIERFARR